jgi:hypothetical protein
LLRRVLSFVLPLALAGGALLVGPSAPAHADTLTPTDLTGFNDLVVDETHQRVFLSGGGKVQARSFSGSVLATWALGSHDLALSPDASRLYVALPAKIRAYDTATLAFVADYASPCSSTVYGLAPSGSKLWYSCSQDLRCSTSAARLPLTAPWPASPTPTSSASTPPTPHGCS